LDYLDAPGATIVVQRFVSSKHLLDHLRNHDGADEAEDKRQHTKECLQTPDCYLRMHYIPLIFRLQRLQDEMCMLSPSL
jgi:hypothetical protein